MPQPRIAHVMEQVWIKSLPLHANAIVAGATIEVGDLLKYTADSTATASGIELFDTATEDDLFVGISNGKSKTDMVSGAYGDYIPVIMQCIVEVDLASGNYNFGAALGYNSKNNLKAAVTSTAPVLAWFWESDKDSITRGLVLIDILNLGGSQFFKIVV